MTNLEMRDQLVSVKATLWMLRALCTATDTDFNLAADGMALTLDGVIDSLTVIDEALREIAEKE